MVISIGNVMLLDNGRIGVVHAHLYEPAYEDDYADGNVTLPKIIGLEGVDIDGYYWRSYNMNLKVLAYNLEEYLESNKNTTFHHSV